MDPASDPFIEARRKDGVLPCNFQGEPVPMILRHEEVRKAARDWKTYSSDAPFRVPIPSEEDVRTMRQLPVETDPPDHTDYRRIVEPFFQRAKDPQMMAQVEALNALGAAHGVGRGMHLGDTILGIKGRVAFEAPAAAMRHDDDLVAADRKRALRSLRQPGLPALRAHRLPPAARR